MRKRPQHHTMMVREGAGVPAHLLLHAPVVLLSALIHLLINCQRCQIARTPAAGLPPSRAPTPPPILQLLLVVGVMVLVDR